MGEFCLELHSNKTNKAHVLDQLQRASEVRRRQPSHEYEQQLANVRALRHQLDGYADALEERNQAGLTLRQQICRFQEARASASGSGLNVWPAYLDHLTGEATVEDDLRSVSLLGEATREVGNPQEHPLRRVTGSNYRNELRFTLPADAGNLKAELEGLREATARLVASIGATAPVTAADWSELDSLVAAAFAAPTIPRDWLSLRDVTPLLDDIDYVVAEGEDLARYVSSRSGTWTADFFGLDHQQVEADWNAAQSAGIFKRRRAMDAVVSHIVTYSVVPFAEEDMPRAIATLREHSSKRSAYEAHLANVAPFIAAFGRVGGYDWAALARAEQFARESLGSLSVAERQLCARISEDPALLGSCKDYRDSREKTLACLAKVEGATGRIDIAADEPWLDTLAFQAEVLASRPELLGGWMRWRSLAEDVRSRGLVCVVDYLKRGGSPDTVLAETRTAIYRAMCMASMSRHAEVSSFSSRIFEERVRQFEAADRRLLELSREELRVQLSLRVPDLTVEARQGTEAAVLARAIRSKGRGIPIRTLLSQIPGLLNRLVPCMLMSPLSVAQYLDFGNEPFDLVVFDEASQLETCKAVGALARAKSAVIVGDPKQMPPTSFFQSRMSDDDYVSISDLESILDDCLAINMPQTHLEWHYRSRHESLISFSNAQFYEGELCTFPSADDSSSRVSYRHVPGYYEGAGRNSFEAKAIVDEIVRRHSVAPDTSPSIGVICFNLKQQNLIEDLLEERYAQDPELERWALAGDEPLFVKNLENVQGDERDVILFSITYAPGENGKMAMRFGPVNTDGGWRRLNVALTRSRREMLVFATLRPEEIDLSRTASKGVRALKNFLAYAQRGRLLAPVSGGGGQDYIAAEIAERLTAAGRRVTRNVGSSSFKVDIALSAAGASGEYYAGILLDGDSYESARTTRDREVARERLLAGLGWKLCRVWAIDWWADSEATLKRVEEFLSSAEAAWLETHPQDDEAPEEAPAEHADPKAADHGLAAEATILPSELVSPMPHPAPAAATSQQATASTDPQVGEPEELGVREMARFSARSNGDKDLAADPTPAPKSVMPAPRPAPEPTPAVAEPEPAPDDGLPLRPYGVHTYPTEPQLTPEEYRNNVGGAVTARFREVLAEEAPIEKGLLFTTVARSLGVNRATRQVTERNEEILKSFRHAETTRDSKTFVWQSRKQVSEISSCRVPGEDGAGPALEDVCDEELTCLVIAASKNVGPCDLDTLVRAAAALYGVKRISAPTRALLEGTIKRAKRRKLLVESEGRIGIPG